MGPSNLKSTATDAATATTVTYVSNALLRPSETAKSMLEVSLIQNPLADGLRHRFRSFLPLHAQMPGDIIVTRLVEACLHAPTGHDVSDDGLTLCLFFKKGTEADVLFEAGRRLRNRIIAVCESNDAKYRINPTTRLLEARAA